MIRITTDADQDKAALDSIIRVIQNPRNYNLGGRNCSEFVSDVLTAARVPSGSQLPWIPNELFDSLSKRYPGVAGPFRKQ